jgi:hypothetical protein
MLFQHFINYGVMFISFEIDVFGELHFRISVEHMELSIESQL